MPSDEARIPVLAGLATRVEGKGQYNIAKYLRAAADSIARRRAFDNGLSADSAEIVSDLRTAADSLASIGMNPEIVDALRRGASAIAEDEQSYLRDFPDPLVCRRCGDVTIVRSNEYCLKCRASVDTFRRFVAVYWLDEFDPAEALDFLKRTPRVLNGLLEGVSEDQAGRAPASGAWSVRQVVTHLRDAESVLNKRIKLILEEDDPSLAFQAVFAWTEGSAANAVSVRDIAAEYQSSRQDSIAHLEGAPLDAWWRTGQQKSLGA